MLDISVNASNAIDFLKGVAEQSEKTSFEVANRAAWMARGKMRMFAQEHQNEGIMGMRVMFATQKNQQARVTSGENWSEEIISAPLITEGAKRAVGLFGGIRGTYVFLRGKYAPKGKRPGAKARELARQNGFFAQMTMKPRGPKLGLFMPHTGDKGWGRPISIFYSLKTVEETQLLERAGIDVVEKNYEKLFDTQFRRRVEAMAGLK